MTILASCLQNGLEILYLLDHCIGRCQKCWKEDLHPNIFLGKGKLISQLDMTGDREPDIIYGTGMLFNKVLNLEKLGWNETHPMLEISTMLSQVIRDQQGAEASFKGVRILAYIPEPIKSLTRPVSRHGNCLPHRPQQYICP